MAEETRRIFDRHDELKGYRRIAEPKWREIAQLFTPEEADMFSGNARTDVFDDIFDGTPMEALDAFEGGIFSQLTSPGNRWMRYSIGDKDLERYQPVKEWLWNTTSLVLRSCSPAVSSFYTEAPAWFGGIGAFGMGTLYQEEMVGEQRILDRTIPLHETYIDLDADGKLGAFNREFRLKGRWAKHRWPELTQTSCNDKTDYTFIHALERNPLYRVGALGMLGFEWLSLYACREIPSFLKSKGYFEMPYHVPMWKRRPGRIYPVGQGHRSLPDARMLQEMERTHIIAAQRRAEPMLMLHDESVLTAADIGPNRILYGTMNEDGKPVAQYLAPPEDLKLSLDMSNQRREAIKTAFYFSILSVMNRPQMTATEYTGWQQTSLKLMGPNLGRIESQGLAPFLARRFRILDRAGQVDAPPPELEGHTINIEYTGELALMQKAAEGAAAAGWVNDIKGAMEMDPTAGDVVDLDVYSDIMLESRGAPPQLRRDPRMVQQIRQTRAQQQQQQLQLQQQEMAANTGATLAHARQASTLAGQRTQ